MSSFLEQLGFALIKDKLYNGDWEIVSAHNEGDGILQVVIRTNDPDSYKSERLRGPDRRKRQSITKSAAEIFDELNSETPTAAQTIRERLGMSSSTFSRSIALLEEQNKVRETTGNSRYNKAYIRKVISIRPGEPVE